MTTRDPKPIPTDQEASARGRAYGVATELAGSIIGMALIGWLIDRWQATSPTWTLVLTGLGAVGGFYNFMRKAVALNKEQAAALKNARAKRSPDQPTGQRADPQMFDRRDAADSAEGVPDFDVPPDLESALEQRVKRLEKGGNRDTNA